MAGSGKPRKGKRALAPAERALWDKVAGTAQRISERDRNLFTDFGGERDGEFALPVASTTLTASPTKSTANMKASAVPDQMLRMLRPSETPRKRGLVSFDLADRDVGPVGRPEAGLDRRTADRLRRGEREPDARLDLHGMTAERAHHACLKFLSEALGRGARVVLVITGKGGRNRGNGDIMASPRGVLREALPKWLRSSPLGHSIVGIYEASPKHGGSGAFYIYLKRRR